MSKIVIWLRWVVLLSVFLVRPVLSQSSMSEATCRYYEGIFLNVVLHYRAQGFPVRHAMDAFNSERDIDTKIFLWQLTREIYEDPSAGRQYLQSGQFREDCIKVNRGF